MHRGLAMVGFDQPPILLDLETECRLTEMDNRDPPFPFGANPALFAAQCAATSDEGKVAAIDICKYYMRPPFDATVFALVYLVLMDDVCNFGAKRAAGDLWDSGIR